MPFNMNHDNFSGVVVSKEGLSRPTEAVCANENPPNNKKQVHRIHADFVTSYNSCECCIGEDISIDIRKAHSKE